MVVAVIGAAGQLGQALQHISKDYSGIVFHFFNSQEIDIAQKEKIESAWNNIKPDYCINAAAYTAVDKAESEPEKARQINVLGPKNLAEVCHENDCTLLHISTDFVFDGQQKKPYQETDLPHPINVYGQTKLEGEIAVMQTVKKHFIVRTSWVFSQFGNNFMKTMLRLAGERNELSVVDDQLGSPTHAIDLAKMLLAIVQSQNQSYGIYHYCNQGQTSWYGLAKAIFERYKVKLKLKPITTSAYPTPAKRPSNSALDTCKICDTFGVSIPHWQESLERYS